MKCTLKLLFLAAALCAGRSAFAAEFYRMLSGNSCFSTSGGQTMPTRWGLYNVSSTVVADVSCPVQVPSGTYTNQYIGISGYNRNSSNFMSCSLNVSSDDGSYYSVATASMQTSGYPVVYATANAAASGPSNVVWVNCHIPFAVSGQHSYLTSIYLHLTYN